MNKCPLRSKTLNSLLAITFLGACESHPPRTEAPREEVTTRHARIIERTEVVDPTYDQLRQKETENKSTRNNISKAGMFFGAVGGVIGSAVAPASDAMEYPQQYRFVVKLDASHTQELVDTFPYKIGECVRVATGRNTGKLSLLIGYKGECDAIP